MLWMDLGLIHRILEGEDSLMANYGEKWNFKHRKMCCVCDIQHVMYVTETGKTFVFIGYKNVW
jgi:hypothetical protein